MAAKMKSESKQSLALLLSKRNKVYSKSRAEEAFALPSFPEATIGESKAPPPPCIVDVESEHPVKTNVEKLKQRMLQHEAEFKEQLHELHRLYQVQQLLMAEREKKDAFCPLSNQPPSNGSLMHASNSSNAGGQFKFQDAVGGSTISFGQPQPRTTTESEQGCWATHLKNPQEPMHLAEKSMVKMRPPQIFDWEQPAEMYMGLGEEEERQSKFGLTSSSKPPLSWMPTSGLGISKEKDVGMPPRTSPCSARKTHPSIVKSHVEIESDNRFLLSTSFEEADFQGEHTCLSRTEHPLSTQNFLGGLLEPCRESGCVSKSTQKRDFNDNKTSGQVSDPLSPFQMPFQGSCASAVMKPASALQDPTQFKPLSLFSRNSFELNLNNKLVLKPEEMGSRNASHDLLMAQTAFCTTPQEQQVLLSGLPSKVLLTSSLSQVSNKLSKEPDKAPRAWVREDKSAPFPAWVPENMSAMHSKSHKFEMDISMMPPHPTRAAYTLSSEVSSWMQQASTPGNPLASSSYLPSPHCNITFGNSNADVDDRDGSTCNILKTEDDVKTPSVTVLNSFPKRPALAPTCPAAGAGLFLDLNVEVSAPYEENSFYLLDKHGQNIGLSSSDIKMDYEGERQNNSSTAQNTITQSIDHDPKMAQARAVDVVAMDRVKEPGKLDEFTPKSVLKQESASTLSLGDASKVIAAGDADQMRSVRGAGKQSECYDSKVTAISIGVINENFMKEDGQQTSSLSSLNFDNGNAGFDLRDAGDVTIHKGSDASGVTSSESPEGLLLANANVRDLSNSNSGNTCQSLDSGLSFCQGNTAIAAMSSNAKVGNSNGKRCGEEICVMGGYQEDLARDRFSAGGISSSGGLASSLVKEGHCKYDGTESNSEDLGDDMPGTFACTDQVVNILLSMGLERPVEIARRTLEGPSSLGMAVDEVGQENLSYSKRRKAGAVDHNKLPTPVSATRAIVDRINPEELLDEFEAATLGLKPNNYDAKKECLQDFQKLQVSGKCHPLPAPRTKSKRRRMGRDFQAEMLPSITSLSRQEMNEDMQTISALLRVTNEASSPSLRDECFSKVSTKARGRVTQSPSKGTKASQVEDLDGPLKIGSWVDSGRRRMRRSRGGRHFLPTNCPISSLRK